MSKIHQWALYAGRPLGSRMGLEEDSSVVLHIVSYSCYSVLHSNNDDDEGDADGDDDDDDKKKMALFLTAKDHLRNSMFLIVTQVPCN